MESSDLVRMANQIAAYFEAYPHDEALDGIEDHVAKFWDRRMRAQLASLARCGAASGLSPLVLEALQRSAA